MKLTIFALNFGVKSVLALLLLLGASVASAADIHVDGDCGFQSAIKSANQDRSRAGCEAGSGHDRIILRRDVDPDGELETVDSHITLVGNNHLYRVNKDDIAFKVKRGGDLTIINLRVQYERSRNSKTFEVRDSRLTLRDVSVTNCSKGVEQWNGNTTIAGTWNICGLPDGQVVTGTGKVDIQRIRLQTCANLSGAFVETPGGLGSGIQCRRVDANGVGNAQVINAGLQDAVDVWGTVVPGTQICFNRSGAVLFLDANSSPRTVSSLESTLTHRGTCVDLPGAGTVALIDGQPTHDATAPPEPPEPPAPPEPVVCTIRTTGHLKLRSQPSLSGEVVAYVARGSEFTRFAQQNNWHQVNYLYTSGWLGGRYVVEVSGCN